MGRDAKATFSITILSRSEVLRFGWNESKIQAAIHRPTRHCNADISSGRLGSYPLR